MATISQTENQALTGTWPAAAQKPIDALIAQQAKAIPLYLQAWKAQSTSEAQALIDKASAYDDPVDAHAARAALGLSTSQGQAPNTEAVTITG